MKQENKSKLTRREKTKQQILAVRDSGQTNMFDLQNVWQIALKNEYDELLDFIEDSPEDYARFIISGNEDLLPE